MVCRHHEWLWIWHIWLKLTEVVTVKLFLLCKSVRNRDFHRFSERRARQSGRNTLTPSSSCTTSGTLRQMRAAGTGPGPRTKTPANWLKSPNWGRPKFSKKALQQSWGSSLVEKFDSLLLLLFCFFTETRSNQNTDQLAHQEGSRQYLQQLVDWWKGHKKLRGMFNRYGQLLEGENLASSSEAP